MKLYICPICGSNKVYTNHSGYYEGRSFCAICNNEVIPLATPQEIGNAN